MIENGCSNTLIKSKYNINTTDLNRIRSKTLWKLCWKVYEKYIKTNKKQSNKNE